MEEVSFHFFIVCVFKISLSLVCVFKKTLFVKFLTLTFCNNVTMCVLSFLSGTKKKNSWIKMVKNNKHIFLSGTQYFCM